MDGYVKGLKHLWARAPGVLIGVAIGIGVALTLFGAIFGTRLPNAPSIGSLPWFADWLGHLGSLVVISGVLAAVTRYLSATGAFRAALSDLLVSDGVLDNRKDLPQLWQRLTQRVYLPGFVTATDEDRLVVERVHAAIERSLTCDTPFFVRDVKTFLNVRWHDEARGIIEVEDKASFELVPFCGAEPVTYPTFFIPTSGLELVDYEIEDRGLTVDGRPVELERVEKDGPQLATTTLVGALAYRIVRTKVMRWPIDRDPYLQIFSPYVAVGTRVDLDCHANGLKTSFLELAPEGSYEDHLSERAGRSGDQRRSCHAALLPGQGFVVIFQRDVAQKPH